MISIIDEKSLIASSCSGCHSEGGSAITSLNGYTASTLKTLLNEYQTDEHGQTVMHRIMRGYSPEDIDLIAEQLGLRDE